MSSRKRPVSELVEEESEDARTARCLLQTQQIAKTEAFLALEKVLLEIPDNDDKIKITKTTMSNDKAYEILSNVLCCRMLSDDELRLYKFADTLSTIKELCNYLISSVTQILALDEYVFEDYDYTTEKDPFYLPLEFSTFYAVRLCWSIHL